MATIKKLDAKSLRNNEHFQFSTDFKALVMKHDPEKLKVKPLFEDYCKAYDDEDEAMLVVRKSAVSEDIVNADTRRDNDFRGFADAVKATTKHFNPQVVTAATKVKILLDTTGNVAPMANDQETSKIYNLIQELRSPAYSSEIALMKLEDWVSRLEESNQAFETLSRQRVEEVSQRTLLKVKETRIVVDEQYKSIIARIEAYLTIGEDILVYDAFIAELNTLIDNYRNLLAQRQGRAEAKKEKEKE